MEQRAFNLTEYMSKGVEQLAGDILRASLKNPKETTFALGFSQAAKKARKRRESLADTGENVPGFLIASITDRCNLSCAGCYARANGARADVLRREPLSTERWGRLFVEARDLGVSFILLAGGEPFTRMDVLREAAAVKEIMFPVFTNGTLMDDEGMRLLDAHRNLVPMLSIEGDRAQTDGRRSGGTYDAVMGTMDRLRAAGILYGASVTVTTENLLTVTGADFIDMLHAKGCKAVIFVEYVPVTEESRGLAPAEAERGILERAQEAFRARHTDMIFISFPGDEKHSGGCLAAGRGFFHISVDGSAEPCPFSPHSDTNLRDAPLRDALASPLFTRLIDTGMLLTEHTGGCLLVEKDREVREMAASAR
jgi:MoaA/NifB/PqqE/SkfB family radical SAM enzyme